MIYIDAECRCHTDNPDGTFREVSHPFFDDKCKTFIEGYRYDPDRDLIVPWKPFSVLDAAQTQYALDMAEAEAAYQEGVNSV